jgi:plastocyanin
VRDARGRAGAQGPAAAVPSDGDVPWPVPRPPVGDDSEGSAARVGAPAAATASVTGTVAGGVQGPGGAVIWLKRIGAETPRPAPARNKVITQRGKTFIPHVLAVPIGTKVSFRNEDAIFHNIFSLSKPNEFDTGLYKQGTSYTQTFRKPGPVQLLCNIHSSMLGFVYVVDSPYYAQADAGGVFTIKGVPPGDYQINVWHESASKVSEQRVSVGPSGARVSLRVGGDRRAPQFVPDKSGKPRQSHLGY